MKARPVGSFAAGTSVHVTPGAQGEELPGCAGETRQPLESTHGLAPVPLR